MPNHLHCCIGYLFLVLPTLYWVMVDLNRFRQRCRRIKINNKDEEETLISETKTLSMKEKSKKDHQWLSIQKTPISSNKEISSSIPLRMEPIEKVLNFSNIMSWFGLMIFSYIFIRTSVNYLNWKRAFKYLTSDCQDIMELCIRSFLIYILGNIASRFGDNETKKSFIFYVTYFIITYTVTYQSCPNIEIGGAGITNISSIILCIPFFILVTYILVRNCHAAYNRSLVVRGLFFGGIIVLGIIQWIMIMFASQYVRIHIHHHYWAFAMALICRSTDKATYVAQACLIAIFIHGITVFGCEDLFQWEHVNQEYFSNMCEEWLCPAWKCIVPKIRNN